ncbi:uncharacterized protein LOC135924285 [Gordionus sp. m RMFG-2023]|uniref:uncharacterized protein LOC135924285 n=1 Tax=Gordionus sp. m RMFG-2023 TaxID=3053472 RepID=UPI0031FDCE22
MAYDDMYEELHTKEGQCKIYRLVKQRERNSRNINGAPKVIKNKDGKLIIKEKEIMNRWEIFSRASQLNPHILYLDEHSPCQNLIPSITEQELIICLKHMKNNKDRSPDDIPIESLKALGDDGIHLLTNLDIIEIGETQFSFIPGRSTTDAIYAIWKVSEKYREKNKKLHMVFLDLENAFDRITRKLIWWALCHKRVPEKYIRIIQDMYMGHTTMVRSTTDIKSSDLHLA